MTAPVPLSRRLSEWAERLPGRAAARRVGRYFAHPDARVAIAGKVAGIVVGNQPFYPIYLWAIFGSPGAIGCWSWLTTPGFLAVPALARRDATAGRALLCGVGMANTLLCEKLLGAASGVGWFALPCALLAIVAFRRDEWVVATALAIACAAAGLLAPWLVGAPLLALGPAALASLTTLHLVSVGSLVAVILYLRVRAA